MREYVVSDLFFNRWEDLSARKHSEVYALNAQVQQLEKDSVEYGYTLIQILRRLRKNISLVNKINEAQAVDIFNDMGFLSSPWHYFPVLENKALALVTPDEKMAVSSFDQFIYADNEFSSYIINQEEKYLCRLVVTLYKLIGEEHFDKETVEDRAEAIAGKFKPWQLNLVFFTFGHIRESVMKRCKTLLPLRPLRQAQGPGPVGEPAVPTGAMWYHIKHQAARTLVFGTFDETGRANMYSVLDHLEILCQEKAHAKT